MASNRNLVFVNSYIYHIYNRGVEKRVIFNNKRDYNRFIYTLDYYRHLDVPVKYSAFISSNIEFRESVIKDLKKSLKTVDLLAYCLMPNHFHLLIRQNIDNGIYKFVSKVSNSYAKYFNTKNGRVGPLFQNVFKSVCVQTDEQLMHVSRYIHLNPVASSMITIDNLADYPWSSYPEYENPKKNGLVVTDDILSFFKSPVCYKKFVYNQADYAKTLESIKHLSHEYKEGMRSYTTRRVE